MIGSLINRLFKAVMNSDSEDDTTSSSKKITRIRSGDGPQSFIISIGDWGTIKNEDGQVMCMVNDIVNTSRKSQLEVIKVDIARKQTDPHSITKSLILVDKWYKEQSCNSSKIEIAKQAYRVYIENKDLVFPTTGKTVIESETVKVSS